jgi:Ca2+-binding RTX toxin-like protein
MGGLGNDCYIVDQVTDLVDENGGGGTDIVQSSVTFSLVNTGYLKGSIENLTLIGTAGINGTGNALANVIVGNGGSNLLAGLGGADSLDGGAGIDTATYAASSAGVSVSLIMHAGSGGDAQGDKLFNIENLIGSNFNDTLEGDGGANTLTGMNGIDTVSYEHASGAVTVNLATTSAQSTGGAGNDTLSGFENITGSQFNDTLIGTAGANTILGGNGADKITGAGGADILTGGSGTDRFIFSAVGDSSPAARDTITDFLAGIDKIDLSLIDAKTAASGNQAFLYGDHNSKVVANSVTWYEDLLHGNTIVQADYNGNTTVDFQIVLQGTNLGLHATDFIL